MKLNLREFPQFDAPIDGYYSSTDQYWIIRCADEWIYDNQRRWLNIGGPGVDGIEFGYLKNKTGVFAYYPIDDEYVRVANSTIELIDGWVKGKISV